MNLTFADHITLYVSHHSAAHLAEQVGVTEHAVNNWRRGESLPRAAQLARLPAILGITDQQLMDALRAHDTHGNQQGVA